MNSIRRETLERLVTLYLISKFPKGLYGSVKFQKVLYFALKESSFKLFTYKHTEHGQYSKDAQNTLKELAEMGHIQEADMDNSRYQGKHWTATKTSKDNIKMLIKILRPTYDDLLKAIDRNFNRYGMMKTDKLIQEAHADKALKQVSRGRILFEANMNKQMPCNADRDTCEDVELSFNPKFVSVMRRLIDGVDSGEFDLNNWRKVDEG